MRYAITLELDNAAFFDGDGNAAPDYEVSRILFKLTEHMSLHRELPEGAVRDMNGNIVGSAAVYHDPSTVTVSGPDMVTGIGGQDVP